jgi:hypothetical protein
MLILSFTPNWLHVAFGQNPPFFFVPPQQMFFSPENFSQMAGDWISKLAKIKKEQNSQTEPAPNNATMKDGW